MRHKIAVAFFFGALSLAKSAFCDTQYILPQVANGRFPGGSFRTTFVLFNNTDSSTAVRIELTDDNGSPLTMNLVGRGNGSEFTLKVGAGATRFFQTDGSGDLVVGAARVSSDIKIGVSAVFTLYNTALDFVTESGVGSSEPLSEFVIPVDTAGSFNTGLAL